MVTEKALYWMAVGVMAFSLGNHFAGRYGGKCLANRSLAAAKELSGQANHFVAMAAAMLGRAPLPLGLTEAEVAGVQARLASVDTVMARQQAACARLEVERARMVASRLRQMRLEAVCPRPTLKLSVPRPADGTI